MAEDDVTPSGYERGANWVPSEGLAYLHPEERVLPSAETDAPE